MVYCCCVWFYISAVNWIHSWIIRSYRGDIGRLHISSHLNPNAGFHVTNLWYNSQVVHISTYIDICFVRLYLLSLIVHILHYFITCAYIQFDCFINYAYFAYNLFMTFTHLRLSSVWFAIFRPSFCFLLFHILGAALRSPTIITAAKSAIQ